MIATIRDKALSVGGRIHPLLGPIFTSRPASEQIGDPCAMCVDDREIRQSDTIVRHSNGRKAYLCFEHDLMLQEALIDRQATLTRYEATVYDQLTRGVSRPYWMPEWIYAKLNNRAEKAANLWSRYIFNSLTARLLEREIQIIQDQRILAEFEHENKYGKGK